MKHNHHRIWSAISTLASIAFFIALLPLLTIGFADNSTQTLYFIVLTLLFIFMIASISLAIRAEDKIPAADFAAAKQSSRKINKYVIITILVIVLLMAGLSVWNSF